MKIISINIELNRHHETVLNFLNKEHPDVVCMQEVLEEDLEMLKDKLRMNYMYANSQYINAPQYPDLKGKKRGNAIFSNNIIDNGFVFYEGNENNLSLSFKESILSDQTYKNSVLVWADIRDINNDVFRVVVTHLPVTEHGASTPYQIVVTKSLLKSLSSMGEFVFCGDMNAPRGGETFALLSEKYKDSIPTVYMTSIDQNLHRVKGLQYMVDGLFTTGTYKASDVKLVDGVSDHMAVVAEVSKT